MAVTAQRLLRRLGFTPTVYDRPADLLDAAHEDPARVDLVITDCNMPGMSGLDVARDLAAVRPGLPVILISGFADRTEEELQAAGIQFRLDKPFTLQEPLRAAGALGGRRVIPIVGRPLSQVTAGQAVPRLRSAR
jgi:CheY-like chemotaxis protein